MKNLLIILFLIIGFSNILSAQISQIALVKPDGTTTIHSTFQAAYDSAADGDYIYLPGENYNNFNINKKLYLFGTGADIDSCAMTKITEFNEINILAGAAGGSIEGIKTSNFHLIGNLDDYSIKNCIIVGVIDIEGTITNLIIANNSIGVSSYYSIQIFSGAYGSHSLTNSLISNNIFQGQINCSYSTLNNNLFFYLNPDLGHHQTIENNIFKNGSISFESVFNNNVNIGSPSGVNNIYTNNINESWPDIFVNPGPDPYLYDKHNNYHVKPTSLCHNSGTDGTDRGIYGGTFPWVEGMVPSNPHIYYKQVSGATNNTGQLQIHFKVRTND